MSAKGEKISGEQSAIYRQNWERFGLFGEMDGGGVFRKGDGDVEEVGDFSLDAMEDEEVSLVYGVFECAFGALGGMMLIFGLLDGLEVEALVDAIEVVDVDYG
ncbi:hypothetical protein Tco_0792841 [Tanacetum coccineum]